jgi:hypothetical protein
MQGLQGLGFTYHSSDPDGVGNTLSPSLGSKMWPHTMDFGNAGQCWTGICDFNSDSYPGLWSLPVNTLDETNSNDPRYTRPVGSIDPPLNGAELQNHYYNNFMLHYNGNRSPFGIWIRPQWLMANASRITWLNNFLRQIRELPNTWIVAAEDVISYMKNPVKAGSATVPFKCASLSGPPAETIVPAVPSAGPPAPVPSAPANVPSAAVNAPSAVAAASQSPAPKATPPAGQASQAPSKSAAPQTVVVPSPPAGSVKVPSPGGLDPIGSGAVSLGTSAFALVCLLVLWAF